MALPIYNTPIYNLLNVKKTFESYKPCWDLTFYMALGIFYTTLESGGTWKSQIFHKKQVFNIKYQISSPYFCVF
jgi:hypothetical protein